MMDGITRVITATRYALPGATCTAMALGKDRVLESSQNCPRVLPVKENKLQCNYEAPHLSLSVARGAH